MIKLMLVLPFAIDWPYNLLLLPILVLVGAMVLLIIHALRKPGAIEAQYKYPASGVIIGFVFCFPIAIEFIVQREYQYGDAISAALFFLCGILFIISGIVMIHEVKEKTEQVDYEI